MREEKKYQASKSTSNKRLRRKRDILLGLPHSEFLGIASTFSGLVLSLLLGITIYNNTSASSINITLTGNPELNLVKSNTEPVFGTTVSTPQTATITSDHFTGYTLTIAGQDDIGSLKGANDNTKTIPSIPTAISENTFKNDTQYNDTWGFLPNKLYTSGTTINNSNYQPAPKLAGTTIDVTTSPTSNEGNKYNLALGAKITPTMSYDSYSGTFVLAATGNGYDYHIGYSDDMTTIPGDQYATNSSEQTIYLSPTRPTKDGFVFQGWCSEETTVDVSTGTTCPNGATVYQPGDPINLVSTTSNNLHLHAIWTKGYDNFADAFAAKSAGQTSGYYRMQDMTSEICDSIVIGSPYTTADIAKNTLIDTRNSKTYLVAKYADGHCWMRENLNYVFTENGTVEAYNFQTGETFNYTTPLATQTDTGTAWPEDASDGPRSFQQNKDDCIGGTDINTSGGSGATCDANKPYERIGVLYNWAAATAQTGTQAAAAGASGEQVIPTSICPKGWRLPANSGDYSFSTLMGSYGLPTTNQGSLTSANNYSGQLQNPLNFNRPGYYNWDNGALYYRGAVGYFWSSTAYSTTLAHGLLFYSTYFYPQYGYSKGYGFSVRCVAV